MWFATDFLPCHTRMKIRLQTLIISHISRELSSTSLPGPPSWSLLSIPTFLTPLKLFTLEKNVP